MDAALALRPDYVEALTNRGAVLHALIAMRRRSQAGSAIALEPNNVEALVTRGVIFNELKRSTRRSRATSARCVCVRTIQTRSATAALHCMT